jgi:hypothetical protein
MLKTVLLSSSLNRRRKRSKVQLRLLLLPLPSPIRLKFKIELGCIHQSLSITTQLTRLQILQSWISTPSTVLPPRRPARTRIVGLFNGLHMSVLQTSLPILRSFPSHLSNSRRSTLKAVVEHRKIPPCCLLLVPRRRYQNMHQRTRGNGCHL